MHLIFDHLSAAIVGATVMLMLLSLQLRLTSMNVEQVSTYMVKNQASSLATWLEEDLLQLGENIDKTKEIPFTNPVDSAGMTVSFTFSRDSIDISVVPPDTFKIDTRLELKQTGSHVSKGDTLNVFRLVRSTRINGGAWTESGSSSPLLGFFKVDLLDANAQPLADPVAAATANPDAVRNTRIKFFMVTPFETATSAIRRVYYGSTLLIPN
ncbi:MAG: hypothetical protein KatS3mg044_1493 [Rhodothermaceae bacterium]|nr:MAG: hypothetical protein KatS3mg044_1493 [Rhodothermaceae bacterium]